MEEEEGKKSQQKVTALGRGASLPRRGKLIPNFTSLELLVVIETKGVFCCFVLFFYPQHLGCEEPSTKINKSFQAEEATAGKEGEERKRAHLWARIAFWYERSSPIPFLGLPSRGTGGGGGGGSIAVKG